MIKDILLAFIPVFVAVDAIGVLPIFISLTDGLEKKEKSQVITQSIITALCLAFAFILLGKAVFSFLGITVGDFMIAGGSILFCIAIIDIVNPVKRRRIPPRDLGAVPIGTPLIVGPAVLTTSLMIVSEYGIAATLISILINVLLAGLIFSFSHVLIKFLGEAGAKALSKVMSLLLAAIAVMMIRKGLMQFFG
ncbi:MAG: MarC family protein [Candidatus Margulisiibacteriota bacterium]